MSKVLFWIVMAPLAVAVIVFSLNNRTDVVVDLWPLDLVTVPLPVFALVLASLFAGFLAGGLTAWTSAGKTRKRARAETRRADRALEELADARESVARLEAEAEDNRDATLRLPADAA